MIIYWLVVCIGEWIFPLKKVDLSIAMLNNQRVYLIISNLVGGDWNMTFIFPYIGKFIILIDVHMVHRGSNHQRV